MKYNKIILATACLMAFGTKSIAQETISVDDPWKDYPTKEDLYADYSRFSLGVNLGAPFFSGDFRSVGRGNGNMGGMIGIQAGYQFSPIFGLRLNMDYGVNRAGSQSHEDNFLMLPGGQSYYNTDIPASSIRYYDLYSKVRMFSLGVNWEVELLNLFRRSDGDRRWALIAAPGIYLQHFNSTVKTRENGSYFAHGVGKKFGVGLGGDLALRYRLNKHLDLQAKAGMAWIGNKKFDGVNSISTAKNNSVISVQLGAVWKIGNTKNGGNKKDNLVYAPGYLPMWKRATKTVTKTVRDTVYIEKKIIEKSPEVVVCQGIGKLPAVYFERGKWKLDTDKYARELFAIAKALKENPNVEIDIYGYADHTGGDAINKKVTEKRAEALKNWLVKVGIEEERLHTYGVGKDMTIEKELRYDVKARRSSVQEKK